MEDLNQIYYPNIVCPLHKSVIVKGCAQITCNKRGLLCGKCDDQHEHPLLDFNQFCLSLTKQLETLASNNRLLCKQFLQNRENLDIFKAMNTPEQHIKKFQDNINTQKLAIAIDITKLNEELNLECQKVKDGLFAHLDQFGANYLEAFRSFKKCFQNGFQLSTDYYFSNISSFNNKLAQQGERANDFVGSLKQSCDYGKAVEELRQITSFVTSVPINTPLYTPVPDIAILAAQCSETIKSFLLGKLMTPTAQYSPKKRPSQEFQPRLQQIIPSLQRIVSKTPAVDITLGGGSVKLLESSSTSFLVYRPLKKYQLDFPVTCFLSLTNQLFVLSSASDNKIHLFDRENKRTTLYEAHEQQTFLLEKLDSHRIDYQPFLSAGMDGSIIVWQTYNKSISQIKKYYCGQMPIQCALDMQNGGGFVFIDNEGRIGYCNAFTNEECSPSSARVQGRSNRLTMIKPSETFISYVSGQESGQLWQMTELGGRRDFKSLNAILPAASCIACLPSGANHCALISSQGITPVDLDARMVERESRIGSEVETLSFEFLNDNTVYYLVVPLAYGLPYQFRVDKRSTRFEVKGAEVKLEAVTSLEMNGKPKMRLFREEDKVYVIICKQSELLIYEVIRK